MKDDAWIEGRFYVIYECRFCGKNVEKGNLEAHQDECKG